MGAEIWVLGGTGRSGRAIAAELSRRGLTPVLVGRDADRLTTAARATGSGTLVTASVGATATEIRRLHPAVVINTVGPFTTTAGPLIDACLAAGSHYLDLANDITAVGATLDRNDAAAAAGRTLVTGAGFGVTATESVVVKLCEGRPAPLRIRVDMVPSLAMEAGTIGEALAGTILGDPNELAGGQITDGRLAPARIGGDPLRLTLPDGSEVTTAVMPLGEVLAAQRASGARNVLSASSEVPSGTLVRAVMPAAMVMLKWAPARSFAQRRLAGVQVKAKDKPREHSWGHAVATWDDGETREGWLRVGEAQEYTGAVPAEVTLRLLNGEGRPGAYTPAALFGTTLAESCGGEYLMS
ncbi:saccharopine dehydrogenase NADP-binding domain-containing protein [Winogradskya humida]|uniref:Membrane protein n=1 Tax=Winogradskya humida TaxID=113566 RepID=A0ABQ4A3N7_9ACTN|nr:saccharopine dehydrogenase NADP-binding domain-containing protein [Actinoplanes humidus]GIE25460.1 membrane protein [Actinoplanes humidus]